MKVSGQRSISPMRSLRKEEYSARFNAGPIKIAAYPRKEKSYIVLSVDINGEQIIKRTPFHAELIEPQNYLDFKILECNDDFDSIFISFNINERMEIRCARGNKKGRAYRIFPSGSVQRVFGA